MKALLLLLVPLSLMASQISFDDQGIKERAAELDSSELRQLIFLAQFPLTQVLKEHPVLVQSKSDLALCCYLLGEWYQAEKLWEELLAENPNNSAAHKGLQKTCYNIAVEIHKDIQEYPRDEERWLRGHEYARKALKPSEHFTLDNEKIAELANRFNLSQE